MSCEIFLIHLPQLRKLICAPSKETLRDILFRAGDLKEIDGSCFQLFESQLESRFVNEFGITGFWKALSWNTILEVQGKSESIGVYIKQDVMQHIVISIYYFDDMDIGARRPSRALRRALFMVFFTVILVEVGEGILEY